MPEKLNAESWGWYSNSGSYRPGKSTHTQTHRGSVWLANVHFQILPVIINPTAASNYASLLATKHTAFAWRTRVSRSDWESGDWRPSQLFAFPTNSFESPTDWPPLAHQQQQSPPSSPTLGQARLQSGQLFEMLRCLISHQDDFQKINIYFQMLLKTF